MKSIVRTVAIVGLSLSLIVGVALIFYNIGALVRGDHSIYTISLVFVILIMLPQPAYRLYFLLKHE